PFSLGIDIGTTSVKVAAKSSTELIEQSRPHDASVGPGIQNVRKILETCRATIDDVIDALPKDVDFRAVAVSAQMHGVCTWNGREVNERDFEASISLLYTWEYGRVDEEQLREWRTAGFDVNPGYGCVTLAHLEKLGEIDEKHNRAGTIGDILVSILCGDSLTSHSMSDQMADSFGLTDGKRWIGPAAKQGHWQSLLPSIVSPEHRAGETRLFGRLERPAVVLVALGDLQATMYPLLPDENCVALNLGTSAQMAFRQSGEKDVEEYEKQLLARSTCDLRPFFNNSNVIVSASMNGGNMVQSEIEKRLGSAGNIAELLQAADSFATRNPNGPYSVSATGLFHRERGMAEPEPLQIHRTDPNDGRPISDQEAVAAVSRRVIDNMLSLTALAPHHQRVLLVGSAGYSRFAVPLRAALDKNMTGGGRIEIVKPEGSTSAAAGAAAFAWDKSGSN
ncbi:hypothetical protein PMAYCL1PPCAC_14657, partial [Pristionchus mayeri]